ncbi:hypothetical protein C884_00819 [Kocuria palustris PEL]|uniref:Uncharacterized protein n=1 Tax=Kocuria palustris PEL TaxID=1236550 RepID=M2XAC8_9MICC|nr:hypothetical protein C884_00819 [Kocuria palustris PEL]
MYWRSGVRGPVALVTGHPNQAVGHRTGAGPRCRDGVTIRRPEGAACTALHLRRAEVREVAAATRRNRQAPPTVARCRRTGRQTDPAGPDRTGEEGHGADSDPHGRDCSGPPRLVRDERSR